MERILFMAYQRNNLPSWFLFFAQFTLLIHYSQIFTWIEIYLTAMDFNLEPPRQTECSF